MNYMLVAGSYTQSAQLVLSDKSAMAMGMATTKECESRVGGSRRLGSEGLKKFF